MEISYKPSFVRRFKKLDPNLQAEAFEKIALFKDSPHHAQLKVHALKGRLKGYYSFSVNYKYRIVFSFISRTHADFKDIGSHDVYR
jgi:mRNA-degrading endonuclease YafQ of YafQ-DinJ toxin-antitoxin module